MAFTKNNTSISSSLYLRPMFPQYVDAEIYGVDWSEKKQLQQERFSVMENLFMQGQER